MQTPGEEKSAEKSAEQIAEQKICEVLKQRIEDRFAEVVAWLVFSYDRKLVASNLGDYKPTKLAAEFNDMFTSVEEILEISRETQLRHAIHEYLIEMRFARTKPEPAQGCIIYCWLLQKGYLCLVLEAGAPIGSIRARIQTISRELDSQLGVFYTALPAGKAQGAQKQLKGGKIERVECRDTTLAKMFQLCKEDEDINSGFLLDAKGRVSLLNDMTDEEELFFPFIRYRDSAEQIGYELDSPTSIFSSAVIVGNGKRFFFRSFPDGAGRSLGVFSSVVEVSLEARIQDHFHAAQTPSPTVKKVRLNAPVIERFADGDGFIEAIAVKKPPFYSTGPIVITDIYGDEYELTHLTNFRNAVTYEKKLIDKKQV